MKFSKSKYHARRTQAYGQSFASKGEKYCYDWLLAAQQAGDLKILKTQDSIYLTQARILYKPDFKIFDNQIKKEVWIEFKGFETAIWRLKRKLWMHYGPGPLRVYKKSGRLLFLTEEIIPK